MSSTPLFGTILYKRAIPRWSHACACAKFPGKVCAILKNRAVPVSIQRHSTTHSRAADLLQNTDNQAAERHNRICNL